MDTIDVSILTLLRRLALTTILIALSAWFSGIPEALAMACLNCNCFVVSAQASTVPDMVTITTTTCNLFVAISVHCVLGALGSSPKEHGVHELCPEFDTFPAGHVSHGALPVLPLYLPGAQASHCAAGPVNPLAHSPTSYLVTVSSRREPRSVKFNALTKGANSEPEGRYALGTVLVTPRESSAPWRLLYVRPGALEVPRGAVPFPSATVVVTVMVSVLRRCEPEATAALIVTFPGDTAGPRASRTALLNWACTATSNSARDMYNFAVNSMCMTHAAVGHGWQVAV